MIRLVAFDLDGVIYRGDVLLPGVKQALADIQRRGLDFCYVSNNATAHRRTVAEKLAAMGLPASKDRVFTSGFATASWLRARLAAGAPIMVVGENGLIEELREAGFSAYYAGDAAASAPDLGVLAIYLGEVPRLPPAAVVVAMDRNFNFSVMVAAHKAILEGALFVATNRDATYPMPQGLLPGGGTIVAAIATAVNKEPILIGKPSLALTEILAQETGVPAVETLFVGDRIDTDIVMGREAGMVTALVLTGVTSPGDPQSSLAHHVLHDLTELPSLLDRLDYGTITGSS